MNDDNLDLLDLDDNGSMDSLPDATPFASPRPKKPWLLLTVGLLIIVLATYIIIRTIGGDQSSSVEIDLDAPAIVVDGQETVPVDMNVMPPAPSAVQVAPAAPAAVAPVAQPKPQAQPKPVVEETGSPVRVIEDRKEVTFNPAKVEAPKPVVKPVAKKAAPKPAAKKTTTTASSAPAGSWYVQFGSYSTRAAAEAAQKKIRAQHQSLFEGKQFVILAAQLKDGSTTYRLRVAFKTSSDANGFCRNAKSDGLDCYVAK